MRSWLALAGIVAGSASLLAIGTSRVKEWVVMTDELLYAKLAAHVAASGSPIPTIHGEHISFLGVVYPVLLAPFYAVLDPVGAFEAAHIVNAVLFASAAVPVFLLARRIVPTPCALVVAFLSVCLPWTVNAAFVMSEAAAYPVFVWAALACHAALTEPTRRRDAVAIAALALAFFSRPQFLFLAAVLPLAALLVDGPRRALERHRVLAAAVVVGAAVVVPLAALGQAHRLLGNYGVTATEGSLLPAIVWKSAAIHLDVLAVGLGVLPFLLGAGWVYSRLRAAAPGGRAFAVLAALTVPVLALEAASYDVRFGGPHVVRDRYVFYLAPLLLIATGAALQERLPLVGIAAATIFFAATVAFADFPRVAGISVDSPAAAINDTIRDESAGLPPGVFVALCGVLLGAICIGLVWVPRPLAMLAATLVIFAFTGNVAGYAFHRLLSSKTPGAVPVTGAPRVRDWIDRTIPGDAAIVPSSVSTVWGYSAILWWDVEFWNVSVVRSFVTPAGTFSYTPFPSETLRIEPLTGRFEGTGSAPPYVVVAQTDPRFRIAGTVVAVNLGLDVIAAELPYRAEWVTRGLDPDGWTRSGRRAVVRVYARPGQPSELVRVGVNLSAQGAQAPVRYRFGDASGSVDPGTGGAPEVETCVPAGGYSDLALVTGRGATIPGPPLNPQPGPLRTVGLALSSVEITRTEKGCSP